MQGPLNASDWQFLKAEAATGSRNRFFRTRGDQILIYPTPTAADTIAYEYVSDKILSKFWWGSAERLGC